MWHLNQRPSSILCSMRRLSNLLWRLLPLWAHLHRLLRRLHLPPIMNSMQSHLRIRHRHTLNNLISRLLLPHHRIIKIKRHLSDISFSPCLISLLHLLDLLGIWLLRFAPYFDQFVGWFGFHIFWILRLLDRLFCCVWLFCLECRETYVFGSCRPILCRMCEMVCVSALCSFRETVVMVLEISTFDAVIYFLVLFVVDWFNKTSFGYTCIELHYAGFVVGWFFLDVLFFGIIAFRIFLKKWACHFIFESPISWWFWIHMCF